VSDVGRRDTTGETEIGRLELRVADLEEQLQSCEDHVCPHPLITYIKVSLVLLLFGAVWVVVSEGVDWITGLFGD
jgi:hypothetical protein